MDIKTGYISPRRQYTSGPRAYQSTTKHLSTSSSNPPAKFEPRSTNSCSPVTAFRSRRDIRLVRRRYCQDNSPLPPRSDTPAPLLLDSSSPAPNHVVSSPLCPLPASPCPARRTPPLSPILANSSSTPVPPPRVSSPIVACVSVLPTVSGTDETLPLSLSYLLAETGPLDTTCGALTVSELVSRSSPPHSSPTPPANTPNTPPPHRPRI